MSVHQVRVLRATFSIARDRLAAFEKYCDEHDRGTEWPDLERAVYLVRTVGTSPLSVELACSWAFGKNFPHYEPQIEALIATWEQKFALKRVVESSSLAPWSVLHAYYAGARQDSRSPLMDTVTARAFVHEPEGFAELRERSLERGLPPIALSPQDGHILMATLLSAGAKRGVEVGTLGGYSAAWICKAIGEEGVLVSIEKDPKRSRLAAENLARLGYGERVECRSGDAAQVLKNLSSEEPWDFVFIDADKGGYPTYVAWAMRHVRPGGLILADNAYLWGGMLSFLDTWEESRVDETAPHGAESRLHGFDAAEYQGMRNAWKLLAESPEFDSWMIPTPEGLLVARKR
ncbi:MAG TPA: O-methyltransferase [Bdellovibrionota bacterium]|nr:O-methyltransferase [Bdellovibrionota bacterium]